MLLSRNTRSLIDPETTEALRKILSDVHGEGWDVDDEASGDESDPPISDPKNISIDGEDITLNVQILISVSPKRKKKTWQ
jgi:hypothetical protein